MKKKKGWAGAFKFLICPLSPGFFSKKKTTKNLNKNFLFVAIPKKKIFSFFFRGGGGEPPREPPKISPKTLLPPKNGWWFF